MPFWKCEKTCKVHNKCRVLIWITRWCHLMTMWESILRLKWSSLFHSSKCARGRGSLGNQPNYLYYIMLQWISNFAQPPPHYFWTLPKHNKVIAWNLCKVGHQGAPFSCTLYSIQSSCWCTIITSSWVAHGFSTSDVVVPTLPALDTVKLLQGVPKRRTP